MFIFYSEYVTVYGAEIQVTDTLLLWLHCTHSICDNYQDSTGNLCWCLVTVLGLEFAVQWRSTCFNVLILQQLLF